MHPHRTASIPSATTDTVPVVTVDRIGDTHRALFPRLLNRAEFAVAVYRNNVLVDVDAAGLGMDAAALPVLRERAQSAAVELGGAYWQGCGWCGVNCPPGERAEHDRATAGSETTWRRVAA